MIELFLRLLNLSLTTSWLILAILLLRPIMKKAPRWVICALWALVAIRLLCPFSLESTFSLIPSSEPIPQDILLEHSPSINSGIPGVNEVVNPLLQDSFKPDPGASVNPLQIVAACTSYLWIAGMLVLMVYAVFSYFRLKKMTGASVFLKDNIRACDEVRSPFILGVIRPIIYVPSSMSGATLEHVIAHEQAHLKRGDYLWKPLGYILLTVYWFNPLCWLVYLLLCRDIEMACDEKVIRDLDKEGKAAYSQALLDCHFPRKRMAACPLAFGEVGVKERVKSVLHYKRPALWVMIVAVILCALVGVCFMTNSAATALTEWEIDEVDMKSVISEMQSMDVQYQDSVITCRKEDIGRFVSSMDNIRIQKKPVSKSRDENRSAVLTITFDKDLRLYINEDFNEIWVDNGVKPSFSYQIKNPKAARALLEDFRNIRDSYTPSALENGSDSLKEMVEVSVPSLDLSASTGADGSTIYYADEKIFIFGGYYGLFVYDVENNQIIRSVDLAPIGCNFTQGENACEIYATTDGAKVLLSPMSSDKMYVYSVPENQMWMEPCDFAAYDLYLAQYTEENQYGKRASYVKNGESGCYTLVNDSTIGELGYAIGIQSSYRKLFGTDAPAETLDKVSTDALDKVYAEALDKAHTEAVQEAYIQALQGKITADMAAGKLPFVVSSSIKEAPLRLEVALTEMTEENMAVIHAYETEGSAITLIQGSGAVQELKQQSSANSVLEKI